MGTAFFLRTAAKKDRPGTGRSGFLFWRLSHQSGFLVSQRLLLVQTGQLPQGGGRQQ